MAMNNIRNNFVNCFNLSLDNNIVNWANNTNNDQVIDVMTYPNYIFSFTQFNETHYRWCGPWLLILEHFAKFTKTKYY